MGFNIEAAKKFFRRETFDFNRPYLDLYTFFPHLRVLLACNGVFFNNRHSLLRLILPVVGTAASLMVCVFESMAFFHYLSVKDYYLATECFCYWVIGTAVPTVTISVNINNNNLFNVIESMNKDFVAFCSMGSKYRQPFLKGQIKIWQLYTAWMGYATFIGLLYTVSPILLLSYQTLFVTEDEHTFRPFQYPVWLPHDDPYRTPNYELLLFLQCFLSIYFVLTYGVFVYVLAHILLHYYNVLQMMVLHLETIFDGLEETVVTLPRTHERRREAQLVLNQRVGKIVNMHISVIRGIRSASVIYGPVLAYLVAMDSIVICLTMYKFVAKLEEGIIDVLSILLFTASCVALWIPCYLGTLVRNQTFAVGEACWKCGWHRTSLSQLVRSDLTIIIQQAQQPITIKYTGFPSIELETFSAGMSKAYSYFNMLKQRYG